LLGSNVYYQKIFYPDGRVYGVELLYRGKKFLKETDYYLLLRLFRIAKYLAYDRVHLNVSLNSLLAFLEYERFSFSENADGVSLKKKIVFEVVEDSSFSDRKLLFIRNYVKEGFLLALDDLGKAGVPLKAISYFPIIKVDVPSVPKLFSFVNYLKSFEPMPFLIFEKAVVEVKEGQVAFQSFELHKPEPLLRRVE